MRANRLAELDVLRGFAVAAMILVVSPGSWEFTYAQMRHADWHGWTFADLVFPDFLFGVGMALGLTFARASREGRPLWRKVARRVGGLILLGLALNGLFTLAGHLGAAPGGPDEVAALRIPGVLQRIALCYLIAVTILAATAARTIEGETLPNDRAIGVAIVAILMAYWALLSFVPVPRFGAGRFDMAGTLPAWIDRAIFTPAHMWPLGAASWRGPVLYDPEGLLSTLPATANVLLGVLAVRVWTNRPDTRVVLLLSAGVALIAAALLLDAAFPINKKLWTSSFVLLTSGFSCLALLVVAALMRSGRAAVLLAPLSILGGNAVLAFSLSIFLSALASVPLTGGKTLQAMGYDVASRVIADPYLASIACAVAVLAFITAIVWPLHRRGVHLRL